MFLLALALAYLFVRVWEDGSARIRNQTPPRHEWRMAKLQARESTGGTVPTSGASRYVTGLLDDVWNSAHERRELLADARTERRAHRAARKAERIRARELRKNQKLADKLGVAQPEPAEPAGFDAEVPAADPIEPTAGVLPADVLPAAAEPAGEEGTGGSERTDKTEPDSGSSAGDGDEPAGGCPWIAPATGKACGRLRHAGQYCADHQVIGSLNECHWGDGNPAVAKCPHTRALHQPFCAAHLEEFDRRTGGKPHGSPSVPYSSAETAPDNVIPIVRTTVRTTEASTRTPERIPFPMTSTEVTGLSSAIAYAADLQTFCTRTQDQVSTIVPSDIAASCEKAQADLTAGGVSGQALTDIAAVQDQMAAAIAALHEALAQLEVAGASAASLQQTLTSHLAVQEAYAANQGAGSREFVTAD